MSKPSDELLGFALERLEQVAPGTRAGEALRKLAATNVLLRDQDFFDLARGPAIGCIPHALVANCTGTPNLHSHSFYELVYVFRGSCVQHFPDRTIRMQEQSFCLLNTQALHGISVDSPDDIVFSLIISKSLFNRLIASMTPHDSLLMSFFLESAFASNEGSYIMFDPKQGSQARYFARGFLLEYYRKMPGAPQAMMSLFMLLLIELMRTSNYFVADNGREGIQINSILAFIDAHLSDVSLDSCSTHFGYSKGHLSRSIKRMTGTSFASLVGQMRLARAEELLTTTEETVENIALSLGYYDKSHFNRAFKAHKGMSPNEFRKHQ